MRVARIRIERFRGYHYAELVVPENMVLAGEPQAGRTDTVEALRRVLDPRSTRSRVNPLDIYRPADDDDESLTEVEVTLLDLGNDLETLLSENLETFDQETGEIATSRNAGNAALGVRLCNRARYELDRSEEHTSELQSRGQIVCRLLLEKKKKELE